MQTNTALTPLTIPRTKIVADLTAKRDEVLANFDRVEEIKGEGFDDLTAVLTGDQKQAVAQFIHSRFGEDPEAIAKQNAKEAEYRALTVKTARQNATAALDRLLAIYTSATNTNVEVGMDDGILLFLKWEGQDQA